MKFQLVASLVLLTCAVSAASKTGSSKSWHNGYEHGYKMASSGSMEMHYSSDHKPAKPHYTYTMAADKWDDDGKIKTLTHLTRSEPMSYGGHNLHGDGHVMVSVGHIDHGPYSFGGHLNNGGNVKYAVAHSASNLGAFGNNLGLHDNLGLNYVNSHASHSSYHPNVMYNNHNHDFHNLGHISLPSFNNLGFAGHGINSVNSGYGHVSHMFPVNHHTHAGFNMGGADDWFGSTKSTGHVMQAGYHPGGFNALTGGNRYGNLGFEAFCDTFNDDSLFGSLF